MSLRDNGANPAPLALYCGRFDTPIGLGIAVFDAQDRLRALDWEDHESRMLELIRRYYGVETHLEERSLPQAIHGRLKAYFDGEIGALGQIECSLPGTPFQRKVWSALRGIPGGSTRSYAAMAAHIGRGAAVRAVGAANGANPISVVIPCHRLVGSDGSLTGYGGGIDRKRWLLKHEGVDVDRIMSPRAQPARKAASGA